MRIQQLSLSRSEDGAVAVMVALFAVALLVVAAFTTDFGMAYAQRQALSTGADSAALAVIHDKYLAAKADPTLTCDKLNNMSGVDAIVSKAVADNAPFKATDLAVTTTMSCVDAGNLQVKVVVNRTIQRILGNVVGASSMQLTRQAVAILGIESIVGGLAPIALCTNQYNAILAHHNADFAPGGAGRDTPQVVPSDKVWTSGSVCDTGDTKTKVAGSGNWGWLDYSAPKPGTIGEPVLAASIIAENGKVTLGTGNPPSYTVNGVPGNRGSGSAVQSAMNGLLNRVLTFPVFDSMTGTGSGATFTVTGFVSVKLCAFDNGPLGECGDKSLTMGKNDMQVQYVSYTPVGDIGSVCGLGGTCVVDPNLITTRLVK